MELYLIPPELETRITTSFFRFSTSKSVFKKTLPGLESRLRKRFIYEET